MRFVRVLCVWLMFSGVAALAQDAPSIKFGESVQGRLSTAESEVHYQFSGEQGAFVTVTMTKDEDADLDPYLRLEDANGNALAEDDDSAGSLNARIGPFRLPTNGMYTIVATSLGGGDQGQFTVALETTVIKRIEYGQRITAELTPDDPQPEYAFTVEAGAVITIDMESDAFDSYLSLVSVSPREELTYNDDGGVYHNARIGPYVLSEAGEYHIVVSSLNGSEFGEYSLTLTHVVPDALTVNEALKIQISGGLARYFSFEGDTGQVVDVRVDSGNTFDTYLTLIGPDSSEIGSDEGVEDQIDPSLTNVILPQSGTYFVVVQPGASLDARTPLTVKVADTVIPSLDAAPQRVELGDVEFERLLKFTGTQGEHVRLNIRIDSGGTISPNVTVSQGGQEIASLSTYTISDEISFGVIVPADGPVIIQLEDYDYVDMALTVTLERQKPAA